MSSGQLDRAAEPGALGSDPGAPGSDDEWAAIRELTPARIGLRRTGGSMATADRLAFRADHARARDAVNHAFDGNEIVAALTAAGRPACGLSSAAATRGDYIRRPDLGRTLSAESATTLGAFGGGACDLAIVLCDGLSPGAIERHGLALARAPIAASGQLANWTIGPIAVVTNGRVAVGDEVGAALGARIVVVLIGERPGLSVPESIGAYLTFDPTPGRTDAERNCISNIHDQGLSLDVAARQVVDLAVRARTVGATGIALKESDDIGLTVDQTFA